MSSMRSERSGGMPLLGDQRPRIESVPPSTLSEGERVRRLSASAGLVLDPWQEHVLDQGLGRRDDLMWAAFEVALIVSRQNGKGSILEALELAALFLGDFLPHNGLILHSAHEFKTCSEAFLRIRSLVEGNPVFERRVERIRTGAGSEAIELKDGKRLRFIARSKGSGRGFSADLVILDEAYSLGSDAMAALLPTLSTRPNPQVWYTSTAGMETSTQLARVRERGLTGSDRSLAFFEWSAVEDPERPGLAVGQSDPVVWAGANPGLGIRISPEYVERERAALDEFAFARERLGIGVYPVDPSDAWLVIPKLVWESRGVAGDPATRPRPCFTADASPGQVSAAIGCAGFMADGKTLVEVPEGDHRPGVGWVVPRLLELRKYRPCAVVIDPRGPAAGLIDEAEKAGLEVVKPSLSESSQAFAQFTNGVTEGEGTIRHLGQPEVAKALAGATVRDTGDGGQLWARRDTATDISPLVAVTLANWGLGRYGRNYSLLASVAPPT